MSGLVIASIIVGILVLIFAVGFAVWYTSPKDTYTPPPMPAERAVFVDAGALQSMAVQQQVSSTPLTTSSVTEVITPPPPAVNTPPPPPPPPVCGAAACNAAMKNMIVVRNSAFGPASPYKNPLPDCTNCNQVSYTWRPDMGLAYTKDGTTWVGCGSQQACYDAVKLPESFIGEPYFD